MLIVMDHNRRKLPRTVMKFYSTVKAFLSGILLSLTSPYYKRVGQRNDPCIHSSKEPEEGECGMWKLYTNAHNWH